MKLIVATLFTVLAFSVFGQTDEEKAKFLYTSAETKFNNKEYVNCIQELNKILPLIGGTTNTKILYLRVKSYSYLLKNDYKSCNWLNYNVFFNNANQFIDLAKASPNYPQEKYNEIINLKLELEFSDTWVKLKNKREIYVKYRDREAAFMKDTFNVMMKYFIDNFQSNCDIDSKKGAKFERKHIKEQRSIYFEYNETTHDLKVDDYIHVYDVKHWTAKATCLNSDIKCDFLFYFSGHKIDIWLLNSNIINLNNIIKVLQETGFSNYFCQDWSDVQGK